MNGAKPLPSTPTSSVVTPWRTFGSCRPSARITSPPWLCRSMNPGATTLPVASIVRPTWAGACLPGTEDPDPAVDDRDRPRSSRRTGAVDDRPAGDEQVGVLGHGATIPDSRRGRTPPTTVRHPARDRALRPLADVAGESGCPRSLTARAGETPTADPRRPDHVRMGPEDEPAGEVRRVGVVDTGEWRRQRRVDRDQVGLLADFDRTDLVAEPERSRPVERPQPEPVEGIEDRRPRRRPSSAAPSGRTRRPA